MTSMPPITADEKAPVAAPPTGEDGDPRARQNGIMLQSVHQSVVAGALRNSGGVNFVSQACSSSGLDGVSQSIYASKVEIHGQVTYNTTHFHASEKSSIREWLLSLPSLKFHSKQHANAQIANRGPGVGQWLLESPEFTNWRDGETRKLWCYGIPGAGKTILASVIIEHLETSITIRSKTTACLYIYFDYRDQKRQDVPNLLSTLLVQLVQKGDEIAPGIRELYQERKRRGMDPTSEEYLEMLKVQVALFSRVFVVIDALDECLNDPETNNLDDFLDALGGLPDNVHVLFTSRDDWGIEHKVQADEKVEIIAKDGDIRAYVENRIRARKELARVVGEGVKQDRAFLDQITGAIVMRSQGMFLLARLHMDFLASKYTLEDLEYGVANLPQTPDEVYKIALERILGQKDEFKRNLAINVLMWLVFAESPLTVPELIHAVSVQPGDPTFPESRLVTVEILSSACAGIVLIDEDRRGVRLAHYTAKQYLRDNESTIFGDRQSKIAGSCLAYLLFDEFQVVLSTNDEVAERQKKYPFLSYAANYWGLHFASARARGDTYRLAYRFLTSASRVTNAFRFMSNPRFRSEMNITGLHVAAYFGADNLAKKLLERKFEVNAVTHYGETALHWAAFYGRKRIIKLLIEQGADLNMKDIDNRTALQKAIRNYDISAVRLLLSSDRKIDLELQDSQGWTPLRWAAAYGTRAVVEELLRCGANADAQDKEGWTALRWAAQRGHEQTVRLLIEHAASVEMLGRHHDGWTVLGWAAQRGLNSIISLLIAKRVDLNVADVEGLTALRGAVDYGHGMTAWLLIQAGADINKPDKKRLTPLHSAAQLWHEARDKSLIWLLLENKAQLNASTKHGRTALHIAAMQGHDSLVWLLLEKGADPVCVDNCGRTALHWAVTGGHLAVTQMLIRRRKDLVALSDNDDQTVLHVAASTGNLAIVVLLLEHHVDIDRQDKEGYTALHTAVSQQQELVVFCLAKKGASINLRNKAGCSALDTAEIGRNETIIKRLRQVQRDRRVTKGRQVKEDARW